mmetsp:Transcript_28409/g.78082  ORF Transcript_28409/g.78082 Transcript_28409/m.78082 type:complete len:220 (+) Transcript_28409:175-834(+)
MCTPASVQWLLAEECLPREDISWSTKAWLPLVGWWWRAVTIVISPMTGLTVRRWHVRTRRCWLLVALGVCHLVGVLERSHGTRSSVPRGAVVVRVRVDTAHPHSLLPIKAVEAPGLGGAPEPRVAHRLLRCEAIAGSHLKQPQDEVKSTLGNILPCLLGETEVTLDNLTVELVQHLVEKRQGSTEEDIRNYPHGPNVDLTSILFLLYDFGCKVEVRATD